MKEELMNLKKETYEYLKQKENFKKQRLFFNMKVEEKEQEQEYEVSTRGNMDAYEEAKVFEEIYQEISELVEATKKENPKYGEKRIRNTVIEKFVKKSLFGEEDLLVAETLVDSYYLYKNCGYKKVRDQEIILEALEQKLKESTQTLWIHPKQTITNIGTTAVGIIKPYQEVAKVQLKDMKNISKKLVHKGSKKLIKVLKKVEEGTQED